MHIKNIKHIIEHGTREDMEHLGELFIDMIETLKVEDPEEYCEFEYKLHKIAYGKHLGEELAKKWVAHMENKDGTTGEHWTYEQTSQYADNFDKWDWYAVLNMIYSDNYNPRFDIATYIDLAKNWFDDKDVGECKTLKYYYFIVKSK